MIEAPLAVAFAAGLVATVNPCGFAMLPAYLSYFIGIDGDQSDTGAATLLRALAVGGVLSLGFLVVFGVTGVVFSLGFRAITDWIPWLALVVGIGIVLLGIAMLRGFELTVMLPKVKTGKKDRGYRSMFVFGVSYAVASLSCTLPAFIAVVATQLTASNVISGVATFVAFGVGMSLLLIVITVALAIGKRSLINRIRSSAQHLNRIAGTILILAGAYIVYFWVTNISSPATAGNTGIFRFVDSVSSWLTNLIGDNSVVFGLAFGSVVLAVLAYALTRRSPETRK